MIIQNVCLSINKLCNDALHFVFVFCIYYFQVVFHEIQFRHTFELNYGYINIIFLSVKHSKFADLYYQNFLCKHWNAFINMKKIILPCKMIVYLIIGSV